MPRKRLKTEWISMLEDFFFRALLGGIGVAIVAGPIGCFIIWRRLAYFGDTLSHSALLGVAMALLLELNITLSVFFYLCYRFTSAPFASKESIALF